MGRVKLIAILFSLSSSSLALAQEGSATAAAPAAPACELHIWPAARFASQTTGWLGGGLLDAAINAKKDANNRNMLSAGLTSESQVDSLASMDLSAMLKIPPVNIIKHEAAVDKKLLKSSKKRNASSTSTCYYELHVTDLFYQKAALYGRMLRTRFALREFGTAETFSKEVKDWTTNGLKLFPAKEGEDAQAAYDELLTVFKTNFTEFTAKDVARASKAKK